MGFHQEPKNRVLASLLAILRLCTKPAKRLLSRNSGGEGGGREEMLRHHHPSHTQSPLNSPRRLLNKICNKAVPIKLKSRKGEEEDGHEFGDGGLWQKTILMGEKCQPPEFSGVIYYDHRGKLLSEPPRSPRASPYPSSIPLSPRLS
ncbi:uncharacterized protein LOC122080332 [Macadamia integrifolia]|uniref:uncharacterized protein LOC122080332 n=1 Tax=Macadamia integrifolia TaxID=60698 RepID=UPI001C4E96F6|nr:uncharacterized protein LOC122080332 [Macadamia integrifolia]